MSALVAHNKNLTPHFSRTIIYTITAYSVSENMLRVQRLRYMHLHKMTKKNGVEKEFTSPVTLVLNWPILYSDMYICFWTVLVKLTHLGTVIWVFLCECNKLSWPFHTVICFLVVEPLRLNWPIHIAGSKCYSCWSWLWNTPSVFAVHTVNAVSMKQSWEFRSLRRQLCGCRMATADVVSVSWGFNFVFFRFSFCGFSGCFIFIWNRLVVLEDHHIQLATVFLYIMSEAQELWIIDDILICSFWSSVLFCQKFSQLNCTVYMLWHCWLGHLTCKNPSPYDLYCVGGTLSLTQSINPAKLYKADVIFLLSVCVSVHSSTQKMNILNNCWKEVDETWWEYVLWWIFEFVKILAAFDLRPDPEGYFRSWDNKIAKAHNVKTTGQILRLFYTMVWLSLFYKLNKNSGITRGRTAPGDTVRGWHPNEIKFFLW